MVRYVAYILVTLIALALAGSVAVLLGQGVVDCLAGPPPVHLTAFDGVGAVGGHPPRIRAVFGGPGDRRPLDAYWAVVRFPDGWTQWAYVSRLGRCRPTGPTDLPPGSHRFQVSLPETHPRLDVRARGTAWIRPREAPVVWVDARSLVPEALAGPHADPSAVARPPETVLAAVDVLKTLAGSRRPVYLVEADAERYDRIRRRLQQWGAPAGPAFWVTPDRPYGRLKGLIGVWPQVRGAVIASDDLAHAAERLKVPVARVPSAGETAGGTPAPADAWRRALHRLTSLSSTNSNPRR